MVQKNLNDNLGGSLHIHKNAAYFVMDEDDCFGDQHPKDAMLPELVLIVCGEIRKRVQEGVLVKALDECVHMTRNQLKSLLSICKEKYDTAWSKEYREMDIAKVMQEVILYMSNWMMLSGENEIIIHSAVGKIVGKYPKDFKIRDEAENGQSLENE